MTIRHIDLKTHHSGINTAIVSGAGWCAAKPGDVLIGPGLKARIIFVNNYFEIDNIPDFYLHLYHDQQTRTRRALREILGDGPMFSVIGFIPTKTLIVRVTREDGITLRPNIDDVKGTGQTMELALVDLHKSLDAARNNCLPFREDTYSGGDELMELDIWA